MAELEHPTNRGRPEGPRSSALVVEDTETVGQRLKVKRYGKNGRLAVLGHGDAEPFWVQFLRSLL
jgi:hypothetical protein